MRCRNIVQEAVAIADEFLESMVLEVDVLHSAMENWVLGDSDTCLICLLYTSDAADDA